MWERTRLRDARDLAMSGRTYRAVEPHVGQLVAHHLGVGLEELDRGTSLRQDLAVDSLDLMELALEIESRFGIDMPDRLLARVHSYGDLVDATVRLIKQRRAVASPRGDVRATA
jgi:acyl carrier protein